MHTSRLLVRSGLALVTAAALPASLAGSSAAASGISVSASGSTVSVVTSACTRINGGWGNAALLTGRQANFAQGRQSALAGTPVSQSAAWTGVSPGTYAVVVICSSGSTAGAQAVIVTPSGQTSSGRPSSAPTASSTSSAAPSRGVLGGLGGAVREHRPLTLGIGAVLMSIGVIATGWYLHRRSKPYRL
ncbi:hypothetical protein AV521_05515 [Streptomyces sp. IMTB 2501]|uniref:hypothetical protein n=1 Tax=Streptomyces sp. IMTB 2501 TaxID=1776340 RepID=UPI00096CD4F3|nr:hypothetical protein [Streptomyces sp. IMTB 2501]OLZ73703.1 hypothetical protein AV521_05515 [Streptomyces sp. IMTB 2501]